MSETQARVFERNFEIEWGQCDPAGIVYYPRYFEMFDNATAHMVSVATGMTKFKLLQKHNAVGFPMVKSGAEFRKPSKYGDRVRIETSVSDIGRSSFEVQHRLFNDDELSIEAFEKRVWVQRTVQGVIASAPLPAEVIRALRGELRSVIADEKE